MPLSCDCDDWEPLPGQVAWFPPRDYSAFPQRRRIRCCSCKQLISAGDLCVCFERIKYAESDLEFTIYGEDGEIPRAPWYMCEECGDLYWSLSELGFCFGLGDVSMRELAREYARDYGP